MTFQPFHGQILCRNLHQEILLKIISKLHEQNKEASWFPNNSEVENILKTLLQVDIIFKYVTIHKDSYSEVPNKGYIYQIDTNKSNSVNTVL